MLETLYTIKTYPVDLKIPIFVRYPAMKFGHLESVNHFAELLMPLALRTIADTSAEEADWVLTSPPQRGLPSGANLVCRALCGLLATALPEGQSPRLEPIGVQGPRRPISTAAEFENYSEYCKHDLKRRQRSYLTHRANMTYDLANFDGRHALFVNDINVTGTQLGRLTSLLQNAGLKSLRVLLIANVDPEIGCAFPQLESEINTSRIAEFPEFVTFLRENEFEPTAKLITRLLSYGPDQLTAIFEALGPPKRDILHRAILRENLYGGPLFSEKMQIVKRAVSGD